METPRPRLDLFDESPCLLSKKCRTSTPSLRPPKPPIKSSKQFRRQRGNLEHRSTTTPILKVVPSNADKFDDCLIHTYSGTNPFHEGSFSFGVQNSDSPNHEEYSRMYQQFEIISKIGSGYFADVYKVKSLKDGHYYAIKKTTIPFTSNSDRLRKLQEVKNHQSLPYHQNCVRYYDSWEEDGFLFIQTELCRTSLNEILETSEDHKLPEHIVWSYLSDLLLAVKHLHDHDLIHMDIKPDNIFIAFDGKAKLGDFGLMCNCQDLNSSVSFNVSGTSNILTRSTSTSTPLPNAFNKSASKLPLSKTRAKSKPAFNPYPAPCAGHRTTETLENESSEYFLNQPVVMDHDDSGIINRSDESIDSIDEGDSKYLASETMQGKFTKAADIFSLGITIFEVASGLDLPQRGKVYHKLRHNEIEDLYFNGLSVDLVRIIKAMMEKDYTKRPTIDQLLQLDAVRSRLH